MSVRNCGELGKSLQKICSRLLANDDLIKLLYYADSDPITQKSLSAEEKQKLFNDLVCVVPNVGTRTDSRSVIAIYVQQAQRMGANKEFRNVIVTVDVFVPLHQWVIKDTNLRPFAILGKIQESLDGRTINGLGKLEGGDFELSLLTDEMSCYRQFFSLVEYD